MLSSPISLGTLSTYALYAGGSTVNVDSNFNGHTGSTNILNGLSYTAALALSGNAINFVGGGSYVSPRPAQAVTDFNTLSSALALLSYTPETLLTGLGPGDYSFSSATAVPSTLTLNTPGTYVFKFTGASLSLTNITIILGPGVSSDDVFWYLPSGSIQVNNSNFAGDIVTAGSAQIVANNTSPLYSITNNGRVFAAGSITTDGINGDSLNFSVQTASPSVPEPGTLAFFSMGLGAMVFALRRRR